MSDHTADAVDNLQADHYRLGKSVVPRRYDVELAPDLAAATFTGTVKIAVDVVEPTPTITLNAIELAIVGCTVDGASATWTLEPETERMVVIPQRPIDVGSATIDIEFTGTLNDKLRGFYRSTFVDDDGNEHVIATTQMQATDCRRAFPCWDEPEFKAVFAITLVIDPALTAVSNSPAVGHEQRPDGKAVVRFGDTMVMSTYLVAFVVGRLEATDPVDVDGIALRVYHVPGKGHLAGFALDVGAFALRWFQDYYGIPYPGDKVDLLGLPDFAAGAMENFGCITFRESALLIDPATSTHSEQESIADVVAHELAHMWFGDLVTMRWWNGIWLNEAFATFMEIAASDAFRPDWDRWTTFGLERSARLRGRLAGVDPPDRVRGPLARRCRRDVRRADLPQGRRRSCACSSSIWARSSSAKASATTYAEHAYGNTETSDLWDAIEETSGQPVRSVMDSWIWQPGYPVVRATLDGDVLVLSQQRFSFGDTADTATWLVPVIVRNGDRTDRVLLDEVPARVALADPAAVVVVNAGGHGFYRVEYSTELRQRLAGEALDRPRHAGALQPRRRCLGGGHGRSIGSAGVPGLRRGFRGRTPARRVAGDPHRAARARSVPGR